MKKYLFAICMLIGFGMGCSEDISEEGASTGSLTGIVADKTTGQPVATVRLELSPGGSSTVTGSDGSFSFKSLQARNYTVKLAKEGYKSTEQSVTVQAGIPTETHLLIERIPAVITLDREVLDFGDNASMNTLSFNMVNNNYVDLEYRIIENCGWIESVDPASGTLPYGKTGTVVVKIDREALLAGVNETMVVVSTSDGSSELKVRATGFEKGKATLNTLEATEVKACTARLNGEILSSGHPAYTERGFVYSLSPMPDHQNTIAVMTALVTDDAQFSVALSELEMGKTYYARAYAVNEIGTAYSTNQIRFTTQAILPEVTLLGGELNSETMTATIYAQITDPGDPAYTECGIAVSTTNTNPTIYDTKFTATADGYGKFEIHNIPCPDFDTYYYFRAYATNAAGTAYSEMKQGILATSLPEVKTLAITDKDAEHNSAVLHGQITHTGLPAYTERGFVYSDVYESPTIYDSKIIVEGTGTGTFEHRSTLSSDKSYYVRAYAISAKGVAYGDVVKLFQKDYIELPAAGIGVQPKDGEYAFWDDAYSYCENSTLANLTDWRLPTIDELFAMYEHRAELSMEATYNKEYWSSSSENGENIYFYYINFYTGYCGSIYWNSTTRCKVRCVRSIK